MQFKRQGKRMQILAYRGYDKEKRRAIVKMVGSYDVYTYALADGLLDNLTEDEKEELQAHIDSEVLSNKNRQQLYSIKYADSQLKIIADSIKNASNLDFLSDDKTRWAADVWAGIDALTKELKKQGIARPKKETLQKSSPTL